MTWPFEDPYPPASNHFEPLETRNHQPPGSGPMQSAKAMPAIGARREACDGVPACSSSAPHGQETTEMMEVEVEICGSQNIDPKNGYMEMFDFCVSQISDIWKYGSQKSGCKDV